MFKSNSVIHSINTRHWSDLYLPTAHLSKVQKEVYHSDQSLQLLTSKDKMFILWREEIQVSFKKVFLEGSFYTIQEYFDWNLLSNTSVGNLPIISDCWYCSFNN